MDVSKIRNQLFLIIQELFFSKNNVRNIFLGVLIIFIPTSYLLRNYYDIVMLNEIINGDMFNSAGILAGFVFTGLSFICVSDSKMINDLRETDNFVTIKNFYVYSISSYISVMLLFLLKPFVINNNIINGIQVISNTHEIIIKVYFLIIMCTFVFACILFLFCLFVLNKRLNE